MKKYRFSLLVLAIFLFIRGACSVSAASPSGDSACGRGGSRTPAPYAGGASSPLFFLPVYNAIYYKCD